MKRPKNIYIVRHGESEANVNRLVLCKKPDYAINLTPKGEVQAQEAGKILTCKIGTAPIACYSSPFFRAKQTLFNIKKAFVPSKVLWTYEDIRLREQEYGNFQKEDMSDYERERLAYGSFFYRFPLGESGGDVYNRCSGFLETLYRDFNKPNCPDDIVIVSHGFTIRVLLARWLHIDFVEFQRMNNPKNCQIIQLTTDPDGKYRLTKELSKTRGVPYEYQDNPNS